MAFASRTGNAGQRTALRFEHEGALRRARKGWGEGDVPAETDPPRTTTVTGWPAASLRRKRRRRRPDPRVTTERARLCSLACAEEGRGEQVGARRGPSEGSLEMPGHGERGGTRRRTLSPGRAHRRPDKRRRTPTRPARTHTRRLPRRCCCCCCRSWCPARAVRGPTGQRPGRTTLRRPRGRATRARRTRRARGGRQRRRPRSGRRRGWWGP